MHRQCARYQPQVRAEGKERKAIADTVIDEYKNVVMN